jgi:hypothetical protein
MKPPSFFGLIFAAAVRIPASFDHAGNGESAMKKG